MTEEEALEKTKALRARIVAGEDFATIAKAEAERTPATLSKRCNTIVSGPADVRSIGGLPETFRMAEYARRDDHWLDHIFFPIFALGLILQVLRRVGMPYSFDPGAGLLLTAVFVIVFLNLSLFAFNLLPIPGLDGWNIIEAIFKSRNARFFFNVSVRRREIWAGCAIALVVFQFLLGINLLSVVMTPFYEPASLISLGECDGYRIPGLVGLFPCLR